MAYVTETRCCKCHTAAARLDENGLCERCYIEAGSRGTALDRLEELVDEALHCGLTPAQLLRALNMSLSRTEGPLPGTIVCRQNVETVERGIWPMPSSSFEEDLDDFTRPRLRNRIALLRSAAGLSLESVAEKIGVPMEEVALWEQDVLPADEHAAAAASMCNLFRASPAFVFGLDVGEAA